jgi:predicted small secreted protein
MWKKMTILALLLFALSGAGLLLGACHTIAGAGEDVSHAGHAVERSADRHAP